MKRCLIHRVVWAICLATWVPAMLSPEGACYVGADGMEWARVYELYDQADASEVLGKFKAEVDALKQVFNTHAPKKVRDRISNTSAMGTV